jgi:hypothetical protein
LREYADTWLMTSGYKDETVPRLAGEIVYKNKLKNRRRNVFTDEGGNIQKKVYAVGIANWANIKHREELICLTSPLSPLSVRSFSELHIVRVSIGKKR